MVTFITNDVDCAMTETRKADYLPRWAMDEQIYNCESERKIKKGFWARYFKAFFS